MNINNLKRNNGKKNGIYKKLNVSGALYRVQRRVRLENFEILELEFFLVKVQLLLKYGKAES